MEFKNRYDVSAINPYVDRPFNDQKIEVIEPEKPQRELLWHIPSPNPIRGFMNFNPKQDRDLKGDQTTMDLQQPTTKKSRSSLP